MIDARAGDPQTTVPGEMKVDSALTETRMEARAEALNEATPEAMSTALAAPAAWEGTLPVAPPSLNDARLYCERLARSHYENFPVATLLLPKALRPHFY